MTLKLIDLFETKFIAGQNSDDSELFNNIHVHNILDLNLKIREQFILIISTYHKSLFIVNVFKKYYKNGEWSNLKGQYLNSFCLSNNCENKYDWQNLENEEFLKNNEIEDGYFVIDDSYNHSILSDDYDLFINLKSRYYFLNQDLDNSLEEKAWGRTYNFKSIKWQVYLYNLIIGLYGSGINELNFRCKTFEKKNLKDLYFPNFKEDSLVYRKFSINKMGVCDNCEETININYNLWHNPCYGDMCQHCFTEKKTREDYRKEYFKRYIVSLGKRVLFKIELEKTKKRLNELSSFELNDTVKYNFIKKMTSNIIKSKERNVMECCVCLEEMTSDIYAGSCGHCLHDICYFKLNSNKCPMCRKEGYFRKLHL